MIKLKNLLPENMKSNLSDKHLVFSKDGASKQFLRDFDKAFKKKSKELGYGKLDKKVKDKNIQVSEPADFGKPISRKNVKEVHVDYQVGEAVVPGRKLYTYPLEAFIKDMKKGFSGYKIHRTGVNTHFYLEKGGNIYNISYTPSMDGAYVMGSSRL